ncbi:aminotransferase class I/II-fold pyridoxal phosphate-dependent enzyme [Portibacter lacus]|uniref:8-amino-7-oxononanoate synthase 1 n=1 Tax=Portibacter lacus TaxID=1099794 RepID=A0AA37SUI7_9BACT|nr:pyridoxal phosphate-dependent aminotransferase family protein [Portibacter lacus]GLR19974.1 8-amino-7-oxononanoate synthase 1 [Portibacter lacus]
MLGPEINFTGRNQINYEGNDYLYLAGIDYHRMSTNPIIANTICQAVTKYGISPTGSRITTGNHILLNKLEQKVADFFDTDASAVYTTGYLSNLIMLQAIADDFDIFIMDEGSHSSLESAVKITGKKVIKFKFLDAQHLQEMIEQHVLPQSKVLVMTDGVFPARGDMAPLEDYVQILSKYDGKILVDDAHAMAVIGPTGKGTWEEKGVDKEMIYQTGTLSKGFGTLGGVITGSAELIEKIQNKSSAYVGSTGLALPLAAAGIRSIDYLLDNPDLITGLQQRTLKLKQRFKEIGFEMPNSTVPIFSITYHDEERNLILRDLLLKNGIYPPFINYPGSPEGGHFRFILTSDATEEEIDLLFNTVKSSL